VTAVPPIDVDLGEVAPADFVRLLVSRSLSDDPMVWAELGWDAGRYGRSDDLAAAWLGLVGPLLGALAAQRGCTPAELWQRLMLDEAAR
jgi:hypothetical protein